MSSPLSSAKLSADAQAGVQLATQQQLNLRSVAKHAAPQSVQGERLCFTYPTLFYPLIVDASFRLQLGGANASRVGLVGPNGQGKTTLLRLLLGELQADSGKLTQPAGGIAVAYLPQTLVESCAAVPVREFVLAPAKPLLDMRADLQAIEAQMQRGLSDSADDLALLERYGDLQETFSALGGYDLDRRVEHVLQGLGLVGDAVCGDLLTLPLGLLSMGQRMRAALARLLLSPADLLVLDEPTNHLDADALVWLETHLCELRGPALLVVSHDRAFLDRVVNEVWFIERGTLRAYSGNYSAAEQEREAEHARQLHAYNTQQQEIRRLETSLRERLDWSQERERDKLRTHNKHTDGMIDRGFVGACAARQAKRAIATRRRIEHEIDHRKAELPKLARSASIAFHCPTYPPARMLSARGLCIRRGDRVLIQNLDLDLTPRARFALVGPNGSGKSTLLATLAGHLPPSDGSLHINPDAHLSYLPQSPDALRACPDFSAVQAVNPDNPNSGWARTILGALGLIKDDALRLIRDLSPGQLARVALAQLIHQPAHILLLDEPTNHLDLTSIEALETAIKSFAGAVVIATHDRRLIERLSARVISLPTE